MNQITIYSKPGCHLCEQLKQDLVDLQRECAYQISEFNIENDLATFERFKYLIPVLELADGTLLYPPHDIHYIRARLAVHSPNHCSDS